MRYVDVHTPKIAMRFCGRGHGKPSGYELRRALKSDADTIQGLHAEATRDRIGFTPRAPGLIRGLFTLGFVRPESIRMMLRDGRVVGYVELEKNPRWTRFDEVVFSPRAELDDVVALLESEAANRWLLLRNTFVQDAIDALKSSNYSWSDNAYYGLLAAPLDGARSKPSESLGTSDPRFSCQYLDYF